MLGAQCEKCGHPVEFNRTADVAGAALVMLSLIAIATVAMSFIVE